MHDYFKRGWLLLWLLIIPLFVIVHAHVDYAQADRALKPVTPPKAVEARVVAVAATPTPTPTPSSSPTPTPAPTRALTWRDNPQHCDLKTQRISLTPPFNCVPKATPTPVSAPKIAAASYGGSHEDWMRAAGIPSSDWMYVDYIVSHESGWRYTASNPSSHAYGLCQSLPGNKMASAGADWQSNPITQLRWCNSYSARYGGWYGSYLAWQRQHWW